MLPSHLIVEFWDTVKNYLLQRQRLSEAEATEAIRRFKLALERHRIGDWVYHREAAAVAETIGHGWEQGFPDPPMSATAAG